MANTIPPGVVDLESIEDGDGAATASAIGVILASLNTLLSKTAGPVDTDVHNLNAEGDIFAKRNLWLNNAILLDDNAGHEVTIDGSTELLSVDLAGAAAETYEPYLVLKITSAVNTPELEGLSVDASPQGQTEGRARMLLMVNATTTPVKILHDVGSSQSGGIRCPNEQDFTLLPYQAIWLMGVPAATPQGYNPWLYWVVIGTAPLLNRQSYTPTWSTGGVQPALGDGTLTGTYSKVGNLVFFDIRLAVGSTTTFGTGSWLFSLPSTNAMTSLPVTGVAIDSSAGAVYTAICTAGSGTTAQPRTNANPAVGYNGTSPFAWANGDTLNLMGWYSEV